MKNYFTYALYSERFNRLYIGQSDDIDRRLKQHNTGRVNSTKYYKPCRLIYSEKFESRNEAVRREKELKLKTGREFLKKFI